MSEIENVSYWTLAKHTWQLATVLKKPKISEIKLGRMRECFNAGKHKEVVAKLLGNLGLKTKVHFDFMPDNFLLDEMKKLPNSDFSLQAAAMFGLSFAGFGYREPAYVMIGDGMPALGTKAFEHHVTEMKVGESMKLESFESFITVIVHELMHVSLFSRCHPLRRDEFATDIGVLLSGYAEVAKIGRIGRGREIGYLNSKQFRFVYWLVKLIDFLKRK